MRKMKYLPLCLMAATAFTLNAGPAKRTTVTLTQPSGTTLEATFCGDEFGSFYVDRSGQRLHRDSLGYWRPMSALQAEQSFQQQLTRRRERSLDNTTESEPLTRSAETRAKESVTLGEHRMLTLLIQFPDLQFTLGTKEQYDQMLNGTDYTYQGATGSAQRYFRDNSMEQFIPTFDIVGPVTLSHEYAYYGGNDTSGSDKRAREAIVEGIKLAISEGLITDLTPYDNDGDKYVDLVYVFYAGYSEAAGAGDDYIWPHQWVVGTNSLKIGNIRFNKYACSSELSTVPTDKTQYLDGIGSCVHEFSHGLGLPDFYNTGSQAGCYGMDKWSVMDQGCYNNDGKTPPNFTAYERQTLGWLECTPLPEDSDIVLPRLATDNVAYVYYNPSNKNEAFFFENHQAEGWDAYYDYSISKLHGMFITHLDYDTKVWDANEVNADPTHQHYTLVPADGNLLPYDQADVTTSAGQKKFLTEYRNDIWPGRSGQYTEFSRATTPSATFFTGDSATFHISGIKEDADGNICFHVHPYGAPEHVTPSDSTSSAIALIPTDATESHYVDIYDLAGRRVLSAVERTALSTLPLRPGYYMIHDGKSARKVYVK